MSTRTGHRRLGGAARASLDAVRAVTLLGRWVFIAGLLCVGAGLRLGWLELSLGGLTLLAVLVCALPWTLGRGPEHISMAAEPARVTVGEPAVARVIASAPAGARVRGVRIEVPIRSAHAEGLASVDLPTVRAGEVARRDIVVPTDRRAIVDLGPIRAVRADPIGLARRAVASGTSAQVCVWPRVVRVHRTGAGIIRDLEGRATSNPSPSDAAFHALREYVPGDDRRHVHWRSTMRLGRIMVRQFVDVRRSELALILPGDPGGYADEREFEAVVSVVASIAVRALSDQVGLRLCLGGRDLTGHSRTQVLDALAGVAAREAPAAQQPVRLLRRMARSARGDVVLVGGSKLPIEALAGAAAGLGPDVAVTIVRVAHGAVPARTRSGRILVVHLAGPDDLTGTFATPAVAV